MDFISSSMACASIIVGIPAVLESIPFFRLVFCTVVSFRSLPLLTNVVITICCIIRYANIRARRLSLFPSSAVGTILFTYAKNDLRDVSKADYVFLVLSIFGSFAVAIGDLAYHHVVLPRLFDEWLIIYGPKWSHQTGLTWIGYGQSIGKLATWFIDNLFP